ncbi:Ankyrin repeat domain-containing protein SOWAHA [Triplophysa tibetana]|uniref:Ankyrin repeat domain-containing protein SOWAHA n=1 Tax=Triplophysa tibetana TaxID=1572043 RepID=A0A5A9N9F8_9TELE|nr:Ankyrin repeat domain-containing protein SOWAHA [Triplophysa tibetana]
MMEISEASLLDYIYSSGGKVKNSDLSKTYKPFINHSDLQLRAKYREEFKVIIDRIAVLKSDNGVIYLILKKKYRQLMQERECGAGREATRKDEEKKEIRISNPVQNSVPTQNPAAALVSWCTGPVITVTEPTEHTHTEDTDSSPSLPAALEKPETLGEELSTSDRDDDLDRDSGSKSESEQDEECGGSLGPTAVALDPIEKEWIFSAASGRLSHLTQLLKQDSSLANKKEGGKLDPQVALMPPSLEHAKPVKSRQQRRAAPGTMRSCSCPTGTALHWAAKHGKADITTVLVESGAVINTKSGYTPLHIAALHGHRHIVDLLVRTYGAKENLRDYSGHLPNHYLKLQQTKAKDNELTEISECHSPAQASERRNRKITSLFQSMKKWGSAEELAAIPEERTVAHQLMLPAFRPRKFSR